MKIVWENNFNLGIKKIDMQHKKLVDIINELVDARDKKSDEAEVVYIFQELISYCGYHFTAEELAMQDINYTEYSAHKAKHDIFIEKVANLNDKYINGNSAALYTMIDFLNDWLIHHILNEDTRYAPLMLTKI